jgi:tripartite-type tricarboxylate transporter receptor subunit TctC
MTPICRRILRIAVALAGVSMAVPVASAETYPSRPVTLIVPFPAGGAIDTVARVVSEPMRHSLGQPVIIENVPGAGGSIGVGRAAHSAPDGYTLSVGDWTSHVASGAIYPVRYDLRTDFQPISFLSTSAQVIVGNSELPARDLKELIAWLKANPDKASAATVGLGSNPHLCGITFQNSTDTSFQFVPYRGGPAAVQAVVAGQVELMCAEGSNVLAHIRSGRLRAYAVLSKARWSAVPEVPTIDEAGLPGFYIEQWRGLWVPKETPSAISAKVRATVLDALADPAARQRLAELGQQVPPRDRQTPQALGAHHMAEIDKWWPIIKGANIKAE